MVYRLFYYLANVAIRVYYRKIYIDGLSNIKKGQAYIIPSNHPGGFLEPIIMACLFPIDLNFLVRGDLFENKLLKGILVSTHQIPIWRFRDGFANLRQNKVTIDRAVEVLRRNEAIMIFAEGSTKMMHTLRPLKKGLSRIAFQAKDLAPDLDIRILPVGINFSSAYRPGSDVVLNIGESFSVEEYYSSEKSEQPKGQRLMVARTQDEMSKLILEAPTLEHSKKLENYWHDITVIKGEKLFPRVERSGEMYDELKQLDLEIQDEDKVDRHIFDAKNKTVNGVQITWFWLLLPFALLGYLAIFIPTRIGLLITKTLVKAIEFRSAILAVSSLFLMPVFFTVYYFILSAFFGFGMSALILLGLVICSFSYLYFWEGYYKTNKMLSEKKA